MLIWFKGDGSDKYTKKKQNIGITANYNLNK